MATAKKRVTAKRQAPLLPVPQDVTVIYLTLSVNGTIYVSEGKTILEVLRNLSVPGYVKTKGLFTFSNGSKMVTQHLYPQALKKLLGNDMSKLLFAKRIELLF